MNGLPSPSLMMQPTSVGIVARLALARAAAACIDPVPLLRAAGLTESEVQDQQARVNAESQITFLNLLADALPDELLGFHLAEAFELREGGLFYFVLASSSTLGEALSRAERYSTITSEGFRLRCMEGSELNVRYSYVGIPRHMDRHQVEFWARTLVRICQALTGTELKPVRVSFAHPRRSASDELSTFFNCEVDFESDADDVAFARGAAQLRLVNCDPYLNEVLVRYSEEALSQRTNPTSPIRAKVENALAPLLPHGKGRAGEVARSLGMSERTLARRLAAENLTFLEIRDEMRRDLALCYIKDRSTSISRIAWMLGYQEVSAFTHAFRRWTGMTPTQMRAEYYAPARLTAEVS